MKQKEIRLLMQYVINNRTNYERLLEQKITNIRYRNFDIADLVELIVLRVQLDVFTETTKDILYLLSLQKFNEV